MTISKCIEIKLGVACVEISFCKFHGEKCMIKKCKWIIGIIIWQEYLKQNKFEQYKYIASNVNDINISTI